LVLNVDCCVLGVDLRILGVDLCFLGVDLCDPPKGVCCEEGEGELELDPMTGQLWHQPPLTIV